MGRKRARPLAALSMGLLALASVIGCEDSQSTGSGITLEVLAGTWEASVFAFTSQAEPPQRADLIADGGSATLVLSANGAYTLTVTPAGGEPDVSTGFMLIESGFLLVADSDVPGVTTAFAMGLDGDTLTLVTNEVEFDFSGDDVEEPAILTLVWERQ
ncbi:MAG: hypothetical protein V3U13_01930 [Gemmatimonadota bacterium]